jgi:Domain of unknown function (DUF6504)
MTRLWPGGDPIRVRADALGAPHSFTWRGRRHPVERVTRRWRLDVDWWRGRIWREYFKLVTRTGLLMVIYHDLAAGGWYVQRVFD